MAVPPNVSMRTKQTGTSNSAERQKPGLMQISRSPSAYEIEKPKVGPAIFSAVFRRFSLMFAARAPILRSSTWAPDRPPAHEVATDDPQRHSDPGSPPRPLGI